MTAIAGQVEVQDGLRPVLYLDEEELLDMYMLVLSELGVTEGRLPGQETLHKVLARLGYN